MPGNGELIRSLRAGGAGARDAARELARQTEAGQVNLTPREAVEVRGLIDAPELKDVFTPEARATLERIGSSSPTGTQAPATPVNSLVPSLNQVKDPRALPGQFEKDLAVVKQQLVEHPGLTSAEQSGRLFEFFTRYAERLVSMVGNAQQSQQGGQQQGGDGQGGQPGTFRLHVPPEMVGKPSTQTHEDHLYALKDRVGGEVAPLTDAQARRVAAHFEFVLSNAGFDQMREAKTGRSALDMARELLALRSARDVREAAAPLRFDLQARAPDGSALAMEAMRADGSANPSSRASHFPKLKLDEQDKQRERRGDRWSRPGKVLGSHMLWNVLHRFRGGPDDESGTQRDLMNQLVLGAALAFFGAALIAVIWMLL